MTWHDQRYISERHIIIISPLQGQTLAPWSEPGSSWSEARSPCPASCLPRPAPGTWSSSGWCGQISGSRWVGRAWRCRSLPLSGQIHGIGINVWPLGHHYTTTRSRGATHQTNVYKISILRPVYGRLDKISIYKMEFTYCPHFPSTTAFVMRSHHLSFPTTTLALLVLTSSNKQKTPYIYIITDD